MLNWTIFFCMAASVGLSLADQTYSPLAFGMVGLWVAVQAKSEIRKRNEALHREWKGQKDEIQAQANGD